MTRFAPRTPGDALSRCTGALLAHVASLGGPGVHQEERTAPRTPAGTTSRCNRRKKKVTGRGSAEPLLPRRRQRRQLLEEVIWQLGSRHLDQVVHVLG